MNVQNALAQFLVQLEADGRSSATRAQYHRHVSVFAHWLVTGGHNGDVGEIDHWIVARFYASDTARLCPDGREKRATSLNAMRTSLRVFLGYCHDVGLVAQNPGRLLRRAICGTPPPRALTEDEEHQLVAAMEGAESPEEHRDAVLFRLMLQTGLRIGSAVGLDVEDLDLQRGEARLRGAKGNREVSVYLNAAARALLSRHLDGRTRGPIFASRNGARVSVRQVQRRFSWWLQRAGVTRQLSPHGLRHRFACRVYAQTHDLRLVQAALTHRSIHSTTVYAGIDDHRLRKALEG